MIYITLFIHGLLAATILPFSSEATLLYALSENYSPLVCGVVVTCGNSLGSVITFYMGYYLPINHRWLKRMGTGSKYWTKAQAWCNRFGTLISFLCWLPIIGDLLALALGVLKYQFKQFVWLMTLGKALRFLVVIALYVWW